MQKFLLTKLLILSLGTIVLTTTASALECPAIGEEYANMLSKLDAIKASVRDGANCSNVALKVKSLEDLLVKDRTQIVDILESSKSTPLTKEQSEFVENYSEEVTKKVTSLYDLFSQSNKCFQDDQSGNAISDLASFVGEAANLAGQFTGPFGTPISLAGHVVAGFLTGLDKVMKSRAGYDFAKPEDWKNYVQNLCTFHNYQDQVAHLLDPAGRLKQLNTLKFRLDQQIESLSRKCEGCEKIKSDYLSTGVTISDDVARADQHQIKPYGTYTIYALGIRSWVLKEIERVERESHSYWADVSGRHLLSAARTSLRRFLVDRESPKFIAYQTRRSAEDFGAVETFSLREGRGLYQEIYGLNRNAIANIGYYFVTPMSVFDALLLKPIAWDKLPANRVADLQYAWVQFRDNGVTTLRDSESSLEVVQGFCKFFRESGYYTAQIRQACTSPSVQNLAKRMTDLDVSLKNVGINNTSSLDTMMFDPRAASREGSSSLDILSGVVEQLN